MKTSILMPCALALCLSFAFPAQEHESGVPIPPVPSFDTEDPVAHGTALASYADLRDQGWKDEVSQGRMTLYSAAGDSVERSFTRMVLEGAVDGDKILVRFLTPAEIKGVAALTHEHAQDSDDNWLYLPANKRVRRISGANKTASFQGTEFTYEDLSNLEIAEYTWRFLEQAELEREGEEPQPVYRVEARPRDADSGYSRIVVSYHRDHWRRERIEYWDRAERKLKTWDSSAWTLHHGRFWRAVSIEMANHQTGKRTTLDSAKVYLDLSRYKSSRTGEARANLSDSNFTTQAFQ